MLRTRKIKSIVLKLLCIFIMFLSTCGMNNAEKEKASMQIFSEGSTLLTQDDYTGARAKFEQIVSSYPGTSVYPIALIRIGNLQRKEKKFDQAIATYQKICDEFKGSAYAASALSNIGNTYLEKGDHQKSIEINRRIVSEYNSSDDKSIKSIVAVAQRDIGSDEKNTMMLRQNITEMERQIEKRKNYDLDPIERKDAIAICYSRIAMYYDALGEKENARQNLQKALDEYPGSKSEESIKNHLAALAKPNNQVALQSTSLEQIQAREKSYKYYLNVNNQKDYLVLMNDGWYGKTENETKIFKKGKYKINGDQLVLEWGGVDNNCKFENSNVIDENGVIWMNCAKNDIPYYQR